MFTTYVTTAFYRSQLGAFPSLEEAVASLPGKFWAIDEDPDHPGYYDVATSQGCYVVEQAGAQ